MRVTGLLLLLATVVRVQGKAQGYKSTASDAERITRVQCMTTAAPESVIIDVHHSWAPLGAQRFVELVEDGFFEDMAMFRCVKNFLVQFGISSNPQKKAYWAKKGSITDDPSLGMPFDKRGMLSFAGSGPNSRSTQVFITFKSLPFLGKTPWEVPFGIVSSGMDTVIDQLFTGYGEQQPFNQNGVDQTRVHRLGNDYLRKDFPLLSYIVNCKVIDAEPEVISITDSLESSGTPQADHDLPHLSAPVVGSTVVTGRLSRKCRGLVYVLLSMVIAGLGYASWRRSKKRLWQID